MTRAREKMVYQEITHRGWLRWAAACMVLIGGGGWTQQTESPQAPSLAELGAAGAQMAPTRTAIPNRLRVHNRVLISVLGKPITVLDVQKQLETQFFAQYPQFRDRPEAKWEYFQLQWRQALNELVNQELVLADAAERELEVPDGDVREELIRRFGADLALATEQMNLDLDEVWEMVRLELRAQKMVGGMVMFPAFTSITPDQVKEAYDVAVRESAGKEEWAYRILTVRGANAEAGAHVAQRAHQLLTSIQGGAVEVVKVLDIPGELPEGVSCTLSEEFCQPVKNLSQSHRDVLASLEVGSFSPPIAQRSRADQQTVHRIFVLTGRDAKRPPAFEVAAQGIQERLTSQKAGSLHDEYIAGLRHRFGITEELMARAAPPEFQPFEWR